MDNNQQDQTVSLDPSQGADPSQNTQPQNIPVQESQSENPQEMEQNLSPETSQEATGSYQVTQNIEPAPTGINATATQVATPETQTEPVYSPELQPIETPAEQNFQPLQTPQESQIAQSETPSEVPSGTTGTAPKADMYSMITKIAVPVVIAIVLGVGGYFVYTSLSGSPAPEQETLTTEETGGSTSGLVPSGATSTDETGGLSEKSLQEGLTSPEEKTTDETSTDTTNTSTENTSTSESSTDNTGTSVGGDTSSGQSDTETTEPPVKKKVPRVL